MKDRMILGAKADVSETAALTMADDRATDRIVEAIDWAQNEAMKKQTVDDAIGLLKKKDRTFVLAVFDGKTWSDLGMSKQLFSWRLKKLEKFFSPENKC